jgi:2-C-methyl-D-erythritol 4-phosphate cytidylyltransferase
VTPETEATAVIAAAGSGERLGAGGAKALVELAGRPLVEWSLEACAAAGSVGAAVVAAPRELVGDFEAALADSGTARDAALPLRVVAGGESRSESVAAAVSLVETEIAVVHDAARPLVTAELIDAVVADLAATPECDCVLAASRVIDTIKDATGREVERTLDRSRLWAAQTPQAFRTHALRRALAAADSLAGATDDAMLVERVGGRVRVHEAPRENLKVTVPVDLRVAALLLAARAGG